MASDTKRRKSPDGRMSLGAHLNELRKRLFIAAIGIVLGMAAGFYVSDYIIDAMSVPFLEILKQHKTAKATLNFTGVTSAFDFRMRIALTVGIVASSPVWLYQIWAFLVPGLTRKEIKYAVGFLASAVPLFLLGSYAGWVVLPHIVTLMAEFTPTGAASLYDAGTYFDFVLKLVLAVGVAFVLPVFLVLLNFVGVLSASGIIKGWRIAILAIVLFTAIATPAADVVSMLLLAAPMIVLYFTAYGIAWLHDRRQAKATIRIDTELAD